MIPLRVAIFHIPQITEVNSKNELGGLFADYFLDTYYFLNKFNTTFFSDQRLTYIPNPRQRFGQYYQFMSLNQVDYDVYLPYYLKLFPNMTTGSILEEHGCRIMSYYPLTKSQTHDFNNVFADIDHWSIIAVLIIVLLIGSLQTLLGTSSALQSIWILLSIMGKNVIKNFHLIVKPRPLIGVLIFFILFLQIIFSTFIKTGLVKSDTFLIVQTLDDILKYETIPYAYETGMCRVAIETVQDLESRKKLTQKMVVLGNDFPAFKDKFLAMLNGAHELNLITDYGEYEMVQELMCLDYIHALDSDNIIRWPKLSEKPFASMLRNNYFNLNSPKIVANRLNYYTYNQFEMGLVRNFLSTEMVHYYTHRQASQQCLNSNSDKEELSSRPIKLIFFNKVYIFFITLMAISSIIFSIEVYFN